MRANLRWLVVVLVLVAAVLAAWAMHSSFDQPVRAGDRDAVAPGPDEGGEDVVARALRLARIHEDEKTRWVDELPELDLAALSPEAREVFLRIANGRACSCGCGFTLAACRRFDDQCEVSGPRARALFDSVRTGRLRSAEGFRARPVGL